jgi:hypothetical protein
VQRFAFANTQFNFNSTLPPRPQHHSKCRSKSQLLHQVHRVRLLFSLTPNVLGNLAQTACASADQAVAEATDSASSAAPAHEEHLSSDFHLKLHNFLVAKGKVSSEKPFPMQ